LATAALDAHDAAHAGGHPPTSTGLNSTKVAIWAFIGSECFFFASLISTYPHEAWTDPATGHVYKAILNIPVTSVSTFVLLMSSLAMVLAHSAVVRGDRRSSKIWLACTALLGSTFLGFQAYEFTSFVHEGLTIHTNLFGSSFFILTGFHGAHVTAGVIWLLTLLFIDMKRGFTPDEAINVDVCALYWHFVDVVWIAIFTLVYLIK